MTERQLTPYVIASGTFEALHLDALEVARALVDQVVNRDHEGAKEVRCHELARAVLTELPGRIADNLRVRDGRCGIVEHSWLEFKLTGHILDVYRPGFVPCVVLVDRFLGFKDYKPEPSERSDIRHAMVSTLRGEMTR